MAEYTFSIVKENDVEIRIDVEFFYHVENDGIGYYEYWGFQGYDAGTNYMVIDKITDAWVVRYGLSANSREEIPKIKGIFEICENPQTGFCTYSHRRKINTDSEAINEEEICEYYEPPEDVPEPDYDYYEGCY